MIENINNSSRDNVLLKLNELRDLVGEGKIKIAIENLKERFPMNNEIVLLRSRWNDLNKEIRLDTTSRDETERAKNKLKSSLLNLIDEIIEEENES